jgi:hypothetical protein
MFHKAIPFFQKHIYKLGKDHKASNLDSALEKAQEWDYCLREDARIPIGIFYKKRRPIYEEQWPQFKKPWYKIKRKANWKKIIKEFN